MKTTGLFLGIFLSLLFCSCKPTPQTISSSNISKYWRQNNVSVSGYTVVFEQENASIISDFSLKNFRFSTDILTTDGAGGFFAFHTDGSESKGYSVFLNNSDYRKGNIQKTGSLSRIRNNFVRTANDNEWFNFTVEVKGNHIRVWVNDKLISEYIEPSNLIRMEGLEAMRLSEGSLQIVKTSGSGVMKFSNAVITRLDDKIENIESPFQNDSTGEMLTQLNQQVFPLIDFHGHLKGGLTVDQVCAHGRLNGYNFGLSPNCGLNFPVTNDSSLAAYYNDMVDQPVFKAMQCEGREWITLFSPDAIAKYDFIFTDAMTWTDHKGRRMRLWIPEETFVDNEQQFMDMLVARIESILSQEPVDIHVNPTFLPPSLEVKYDELWTEKRMDRVIKVLTENDIALEINSRYKIPSLEFVKRAKLAGVKFTFGTNNGGSGDLGRLEYCLMIIQEAGLTPEDMFIPRPSGEKKVLIKGLPSKITG